MLVGRWGAAAVVRPPARHCLAARLLLAAGGRTRPCACGLAQYGSVRGRPAIATGARRPGLAWRGGRGAWRVVVVLAACGLGEGRSVSVLLPLAVGARRRPLCTGCLPSTKSVVLNTALPPTARSTLVFRCHFGL